MEWSIRIVVVLILVLVVVLVIATMILNTSGEGRVFIGKVLDYIRGIGEASNFPLS